MAKDKLEAFYQFARNHKCAQCGMTGDYDILFHEYNKIVCRHCEGRLA